MLLEPIAILHTLLGGLFFMGITLGWMHWTNQTSVLRSWHNSYAVAVRIAAVYGAGWLLLCAMFGLGIHWLVILGLLLYCLSPLATLGDKPGFISAIAMDLPGFIVAIVVFLPIYVLKQFILGFPEHDLVVLSPPDSATPMTARQDIAIPNLDQQLVTVASTLRPTGKIEHNGTRFDATSFDGTMIDAGHLVEVCGRKDRMFVVRPAKSENGLAETPSRE